MSEQKVDRQKKHKSATRHLIRGMKKEGYDVIRIFDPDEERWETFEGEQKIIDEVFAVDECSVRFINRSIAAGPANAEGKKPAARVTCFLILCNGPEEIVADAGYNCEVAFEALNRVTDEIEEKFSER